MNISNDLNCLKQQIQHLESAKEQLIILKKIFQNQLMTCSTLVIETNNLSC